MVRGSAVSPPIAACDAERDDLRAALSPFPLNQGRTISRSGASLFSSLSSWTHSFLPFDPAKMA